MFFADPTPSQQPVGNGALPRLSLPNGLDYANVCGGAELHDTVYLGSDLQLCHSLKAQAKFHDYRQAAMME